LFIQIEETPNPNALKFLPGRSVRGVEDPLFFSKKDDLSSSPFVRRILDVSGVEAAMLGSDFITVTKQDHTDWYVLKPMLLGIMMEHFISDMPLFVEVKSPVSDSNLSADDEDDTVSQIRQIIEEKVRPAVAQDGGDIVFHSFEDGVVFLEMKGACSGCPSSTATLKSGIENMLRYYVPDVVEVRQIGA
jgi:Fe-S cluster biogenesis protein NfuA